MEEYAIVPPKAATVETGIPSNLPDIPFRLCIYGASSSGKGVLINNLIGSKKFPYKKVFGKNIFIFSETISLGDTSFADIDLPEDRVIKGYDEHVLMQIWTDQDKIISKWGKPKAPHILFLFDDTVTSISLSPHSLLNRLFFQGRHSKISTCITSQHYGSIPKSVRLNASAAIVFECNKKQALMMGEEQVADPQDFAQILKQATAEPYSFLVIMYKSPVARRYQLRFTGRFFEIDDQKNE